MQYNQQQVAFTKGFTEECLRQGLTLPQTEAMYKNAGVDVIERVFLDEKMGPSFGREMLDHGIDISPRNLATLGRYWA